MVKSVHEEPILTAVKARLPLKTARALNQTIMEMVADGTLPAGTRMPTIRKVAAALGMSNSSIASAWTELVDWHVLQTNRRGGTVVLGPAVAPRASRYDVMMRASEGAKLNLGNQICDPTLLPPVAPALVAAGQSAELNESTPSPISANLRRAIAPIFPLRTDSMLATHGGNDAIHLALRSSVRPGDRVLVESPGLARVLDIIELIGAKPVEIPYGPEGPDLDVLERALRQRPAAFLYQPGTQQPTGYKITDTWLARAAELLSGVHMPIVEVVQTPYLAREPIRSLGIHLPQSVVHVHSFNFFFGSDLRVGVAGGSEYYVERMWLQLTYSSRWVSRILQDALAFQMTDPAAKESLGNLVDTCHQRHARFTDALRAQGFPVHHHDGPAIWLPVGSEHVATTRLASKGIVAHPGSYFSPTPQQDAHLLLNGTAHIKDATEIAKLLREVA